MVGEVFAKLLRTKFDAVDPQRIGHALEIDFAKVDPRPAVPGEPAPGPRSEFERSVRQDVAARIAKQPVIFGVLHVALGSGVEHLDHGETSEVFSTGANWQPLTKKSKKPGCVSSRQCV